MVRDTRDFTAVAEDDVSERQRHWHSDELEQEAKGKHPQTDLEAVPFGEPLDDLTSATSEHKVTGPS